jgi:hypothetical protein
MATDHDLEAEAARELRELSEDLASDLGDPLRLGELLEVLGWGAQSLHGDLAEDPAGPAVFKPRWRRGASPPEPGPSRVWDLRDSAFVDAGDLLSRLARGLAAATGAPPSLDDLVRLLGQGLRRTEPGLLADLDPADLRGLSVAKQRAPKRAKAGDIVAIPTANGRYFLAVTLDRNVFGTALGLFVGTHPPQAISVSRHPPAVPRPMYVGDEEEALASGRWRIIGHDEGLRELFPAKPEIFHRPRADVPMPSVGPYGSAETPDGDLRPLSEEEAREVGLMDPDFSQAYTTDELERRLDAESG